MYVSGWQITGWYLLVLIPLFVGMKLLYLKRYPAQDRRRLFSFLFAPSLSYDRWCSSRHAERGDLLKLLVRCAVVTFLFWFFLSVKHALSSEISPWLEGYTAIMPFWLMLELLESFMQLLWLPSGILVPAINDRPLLSSSVAEFWGQRWNRLFGDWLYGVCFRPFFRSPRVGLTVTFAASALIHELLVSVPYLMVYKKSLFGLMLGYFAIQLVAIIVERQLLLKSTFAGRIYCWIIVLGPAPMVLNPGTLKIFHLTGS